MIQVSTPIVHAQESSGTEVPKKTGVQKKEPLGVFAKILAGLLKNTHKDPAGGKAETGKVPEEALSGGGEKISPRNRKKNPPVPGTEEAGPVLWLSPGTPLSGETPLPEDPGLLAGLPRGEKGAAPGRPSPAPAGSPGDGEGIPSFAGAGQTGLPGEGAEIQGAADTAAFAEANAAVSAADAAADLKTAEPGDERDGSRDRKTAGKTGPRTAAGSAAAESAIAGGGNAETLSLPFGGIKNSSPLKQEKENLRDNRVAEGRSRDRRRERLGLEVRDFRTPLSQAIPETNAPVPGRVEAGRGETELLVELPAAGEGSSGEGGFAETAGSRENPESLLAQELRQNLSGDIVRSAQIILRDGGEGTIRLSLKPESLGNVKIRLEMAENKITGHIIVENDETLRAFEQEIHSLEQAFLDAGFDGADLDTALASGNGQNGAGGEKGWGEGDSFFSRQMAALSYGALPEGALNGGEETGGENSGYGISRQINMLI
ncbi:MAG: flagellar hook-length control protein FliK [Treponema sp.]|nr:flagellar hook-length control protein FliK [Treponema sp.]